MSIEAIDDSVEELTGKRCDQDLRQNIADVLLDLCKQYLERVKALSEDPASPKTDYFEEFRAPATARISNAVTDSLGQEVINKLGVPILNEVDRTLHNVGEALINFHKDALIDFGVPPENLK